MAFAGVRVLDLSDRLSGAYAARLFGDFGADVVLVEPAGGHSLRAEPPFAAGGRESILFSYTSWNKRSVVCEDPYAVAPLAAAADVLVTTAAKPWPAVVAAAVDALPRHAVHCSVTPCGLDGPLSSAPGNSLTACARTGWCKINGVRGMPPLQLPVRLAGYLGGVAAFNGAAAALFASLHGGTAAGGLGELVDVAEVDAVALTNAPWAKMHEFHVGLTGLHHTTRYGNCQHSGPRGPDHLKGGPMLWPAADGSINLGFGDWGMWDEAMGVLGIPEFVNSKYSPTWGRYGLDPRPVNARLAEASAGLKKWHMFHALARIRCISGVVQDARELLEFEQLHARGFYVKTTTPGGRRAFQAPGPIAKLSRSPWELRRPAPSLGEHALEQVLAEWAQEERAAPIPEPPPSAHTGAMPLAGIRVLAFTQAWAGPSATAQLALLGADVVQIENRTRPDVWRGAGRPVPDAVRGQQSGGRGEQSPLNTNGMYNSANFNKRAITLDMAAEEGLALFWKMVPQFDIVCDNFAPHVMPSWGITQDGLEAARPGIIFASMSAFGTEGPLSSYPGNGNTTEPMAGISAMNGYEGGSVANTGGLCPDPISGFFLAASILAALHHRELTRRSLGRPEGQRITGAMLEAVACTAPGDAIAELSCNGGEPRGPQGNRHPRFAPHSIYEVARREGEDVAPSSRRWVALAVETDATWAAFAARAGIADERLATNAGRKEHEAHLDELVAAYMASVEDVDAEVAALAGLGLCAAECLDFVPAYVYPSEQWIHRGFMEPVTHPESGTHMMPTTAWQLRRRPPLVMRYSPMFGEHSAEVLQAEAGIGPEEYTRLEVAGITGTRFDGLQPTRAKL